MALTVTWGTKVINVLQADLTPVSGTLYELDTDQFRKDLKNLEDGEDGMPFPDTHKHNTEVTVAGVTYARFIEIINGYSITFQDGQYTVRLVGSNNNFFDVENGILNQNQVQIIAGNAAGLITVVSGSGVTPQDKLDIADAVWADSEAVAVIADVNKLLGLSHENIYIDQTVFDADHNLISARVRIYSVAGSVGSGTDIIDTYIITAVGSGPGEFSTFKQVKQ